MTILKVDDGSIICRSMGISQLADIRLKIRKDKSLKNLYEEDALMYKAKMNR